MQHIFTAASIRAIEAYQRHLSPRKGYRCAYSVLHGGTGCSGFAKHAIATEGVFAAFPMILDRFEECRDAARHLRTDLDCGCAGDALPGNCDLPDACPGGGGKSRTIFGCLDFLDIPFCDWPGDSKKKKKKPGADDASRKNIGAGI